MGSPPHTRDKSRAEFKGAVPTGITPAYAGQINPLPTSIDWGEDHPRIRGTNNRTRTPTGSEVGSPPHTRDKFDLRP